MMKTPPFLISVALLFWGWQTKLWIFAVLIAIALEGSRLINTRWDFSLTEFTRIADLSSLMLIGVLVFLGITQDFYNILFIFLQWLPVVLFPVMAGQCYSSVGTVDIRALFMTVRQRKKVSHTSRPIAVDLSYYYVIICIVAAGAANTGQINRFYAGLLVLTAWALWSTRSQRYSPVVWVIVIVIAAVMGYAGHIQLNLLQRSLERSEFIGRLIGGLPSDPDPYQSITAIGSIGRVKLSNQVIFRVKSETGYRAPLLLRETAYNTYRSSKWFAARFQFEDLEADLDGSTWQIHAPTAPVDSVVVSSYLTDGIGILKVPTGTVQVDDLPVLILQMNQYGALKVESGPKIVTYRANFMQQGALDSPPDETDLTVPPDELPAIEELVEQLGLRSLDSPQLAMQRISAFFQQAFSYSLNLDRQARNKTPLADFLLNVRTGHCEYFATATVLLLRAAGIPARYAAGYSIDGLDQPGEWTMVRGRHAHAWTLAYLDGVWRDFDTTPPSWRGIEEAEASAFEWVSDLWAHWRFLITEWRQSGGGEDLSPYWLFLLIPLFVILGRKLYAKKRVKRIEEKIEEETIRLYPGLDSGFYVIEQQLQQSGLMRHSWETFSAWLTRLEQHRSSPLFQSLKPLLMLHYRYRFDPQGLTSDEKRTLQGSVQAWLEQYELL